MIKYLNNNYTKGNELEKIKKMILIMKSTFKEN